MAAEITVLRVESSAVTVLQAAPATVSIAGSGGSGSVATDTIWDAAGDLAIGTGANTAARLAKGSDGTWLKAGATTASWESLPTSSSTVSGIVELATDAETLTGTDTARAVTPASGRATYAVLINTDGDVGRTIYVGSVDPDVSYTPAAGDVWIQVQ